MRERVALAQWARSLFRYSFVRYFAVAGVGFVSSYAMFFLITWWNKDWYLWAAPVAHWTTYFAFGFWGHKLFSFADKRVRAAAWQGPTDTTLSLGWNALFLNPLLLWFLVSKSGLHPHYAQLCLVPFFFLQNYAARKWVIYNPKVEQCVRDTLGARFK
jgi:putative flippase GtrA